jgi:hypothetical protein
MEDMDDLKPAAVSYALAMLLSILVFARAA